MIRRILIVDDSVFARSMIRRKLEILKFKEVEFLEAGNGVEALDKLKSQEFHLVFTDLNMPEMDGAQLLKRIKSSPKLMDIPVIIISSLNNSTKEQQLLSEHALKVFSKPLSLPEMSQFFIDYLKEEEESFK